MFTGKLFVQRYFVLRDDANVSLTHQQEKYSSGVLLTGNFKFVQHDFDDDYFFLSLL